MAVFHTRDVAPEQARALFDVALGEFLFFAECAKTVANNHGRIIPLRPVRCNYETGNQKLEIRNRKMEKGQRGAQRMFTARAARRATMVREIKAWSIMPIFAHRERTAVSVGEKAVLVLKARKR